MHSRHLSFMPILAISLILCLVNCKKHGHSEPDEITPEIKMNIEGQRLGWNYKQSPVILVMNSKHRKGAHYRLELDV